MAQVPGDARLMKLTHPEDFAMAEALLEKEMLDEKDIEALIGPSARQLAESNGKSGKAGKAAVLRKEK